jgi:enediyne biosynthesis protein E4
MTVIGWRKMGVVVAVALATFSLPEPALAGDFQARLRAKRLEIPQGDRFVFTMEVTNTTRTTRTADLVLALKRLGTSTPPVQFTRWLGVVAGKSEASARLSVTPAQYFSSLGRYRVEVLGDEVGSRTITFRVTKPLKRVPRFEDVSGPAHLAENHQAPPLTVSCNFAAGAAWGDIEGDGDLDLYLPHHTAPAQLWVNLGGMFLDQAAERGVNNGGITGLGAAFADYDNDGDQDLYVTNDGPNRLYQNDGTGRFLDVAPAAGVADDRAATSASWADYDNDGHLDLYVVNYGRCGGADIEKTLQYHGDVLYHNEGNGTFTDRTVLLGPPDATLGAGFQAAWFDYDHDGDQDLYLANDFVGPKPRPNVLWRNDGPDGSGGWRFTDVSQPSQTGVSINTMGIGVGDYNRDGTLDLALSNIRDNVLFRNNANGSFSNVAHPAGVARPDQNVTDRSITWGLGFFDLNLDGWEDLYIAAGSLGYETEVRPQPNELFVNRGGGRFLDLSVPSRTAYPDMNRGVAFADYDRDGRMDMFLVSHGGPVRLLRNVTPRNQDGTRYHWLGVDTVGTMSNRDGCGARLSSRLKKGPTLVRQVFCGSTSLSSGSDPTVHFGLGSWRSVKRLTIEWPSGSRQVLRNVKGDRLITVTEP